MEDDLIEIGKRLDFYLSDKKISRNKLAKLASTSSSQIQNIVAGRKYGTDKLINILKALPELSREWLLFGEGDMEKGSAEATNHQAGIGNIAGSSQVKQKIMNGDEASAATAPTDKILKIQHQLALCESERKALQQRIKDQERIIQLLEGK
jgi:transcriptional regulator with XRE-family HTH domain